MMMMVFMMMIVMMAMFPMIDVIVDILIHDKIILLSLQSSL